MKKSIPITLEGRVYQGRCLACDPFPPGLVPDAAAIPAAIPTAIPTACHQNGEEEHPQPRRLLSNVSRKTAKSSPPTAIVTSAEATTKIPAASSRLKSERSFDDAEREHHRESYPDSGENGYGTKVFGRKNSLDSRMRELQCYQQQQYFQQSEHRPLQAIPINEDYNNFDTTGIEASAPLSSTMLPQSRVATGRAVASSSAKTTPSDVPKTLEVIRRAPPRGGNGGNGGNTYSNSSINSNNFGEDHSVVSAITMDINLFQSVVGGDEIFYEDANAIDDDLPPPTSYHRRPGPERLAGRSYHISRNHINHSNTFRSYGRRHSIGGDVDSYRRRSHPHANDIGNDGSNQTGINSQNQHLYAPPAIPRNMSPPDDYEDGTPAGTYHYSDHVVPNTTRQSNSNSPYRTRNQESHFRSEENLSKRLKNHSTHTQPLRTSSILSHIERNRHRSYHGISEDHITSSNEDAFASRSPITPAVGNHDDDDDDLHSFVMDDNDYYDDYGYNQNNFRPQEQHQGERLESNDRTSRIRELEQGNNMVPQITVTPASSASSGSQLNNTNDSSRQKKSSRFSKTIIEERDIGDMPGILRCLNLEECNPDIREQALGKLVNIMQTTSKDLQATDRERHIKDLILENDVIESVTKSMWADMAINEVQEAAMDVLLFIAASAENSNSDGASYGEARHSKGNGNLLSKNESVCDSILFAMQNHPVIHGIQLKGCLLFASLSSSSSGDDNVGTNVDGTLSGAMTMVLDAMSNHGESRSIRKAGLQALHHQCLLSAHAGDNKRTFVESKLGNGMPAIDLIVYAMEELQQDAVAMEWACQLCWCLTTNGELLKQIEHTSLHEGAITICQHYMTNPSGIGLVEASIGTIANLASLTRKRNEMINTGAVQLVLDGLRYHGDSYGICYEAAFALENFALPPYSPDVSSMLLKSQAVPLLTRGLRKFLDNPEYVIQGLRALTGIAARSDESRRRIGSPEMISILHNSSRNYRTPSVTEICCLFVATLAMGKTASVSDFMIEHKVLDLLLNAMEYFPDEKVQDAACLALRNLSGNIEKLEKLHKDGKTSKLIISAMDTHRNSVSIQTNCCCIFWNLLSKANEKGSIFNPKIVNSITTAMQSHIESADLLEQACGALWVIVDNFDNQKLYVGNDAIDVVTCAMVMHPGTASTLEKACGFLSNLSSVESLARNIAKAQGVSIVSEAMCNNASSISLLESGCLTLKNIILVCPNYAQDTAVAISTVVMAMNENIGSTSFVKEACDLLWVLASESESIRSKVLSLDGISTLMKCLEQNTNHPEVETAAMGAFNQLAKS